MRVVFHPGFADDVRKFEAGYVEIPIGLSRRFRDEVNNAVAAIKTAPERTGHFLNLGSSVMRQVRRTNLKAFPVFILYGIAGERLIFGAVIPSRSDPLTWLSRFGIGARSR